MKDVLKADKTIKVILFFGAIIIVFLGWIIVNDVRSGPSGKQLILQKTLIISFDGKVDSVLYDKRNHSA